MVNQRSYWLDLFTPGSWKEFIDAGASVSGFSEYHWVTMQKVKVGDYLLCYLVGLSSFVGVLEVISEPFNETKRIWKDALYPSRFKVKLVASLEYETSVEVHGLLPQLEATKNLENPLAWVSKFRRSLANFSERDGMTIVEAIKQAEANPIPREIDKRKLAKRPKAYQTEAGPVTVPSETHEEEEPLEIPNGKAPSDHTEIQWLLLKLGSDMGLSVMPASNDKGKSFNGQLFSSLKNYRTNLPVQFDPATSSTIQMIDVLWIKGLAIIAAFEIESTTSIYSGLLRMSDLISMQPNLNIPLYLVAPNARRNKVISEINRPTFTKLSPPLYEMCRYISFETLRKEVIQAGRYAKHLRPEFIQEEVSESCEVAAL